MDVEKIFRSMFHVKEDQDIMELILTSLYVARMAVPDKLMKHKSRILKLAFDDDPSHATEIFSDDEYDLDDDDDDTVAPPKKVCSSPEIKKTSIPQIKNGSEAFKKANEAHKNARHISLEIKKAIEVAPEIKNNKVFKKVDEVPKNIRISPETKNNQKLKKERSVEVSGVPTPRSLVPEKCRMKGDDSSMKPKLEATKTKLTEMYRQPKRKIGCIDYLQSINLYKEKAHSDCVQERLFPRMKRMRH